MIENELNQYNIGYFLKLIFYSLQLLENGLNMDHSVHVQKHVVQDFESVLENVETKLLTHCNQIVEMAQIESLKRVQ